MVCAVMMGGPHAPSCQIHQVYDRCLGHVLSSLILCLLHEADGHYGVSAGGRGVHVGGGDGPVLCPLGNPLLYVIVVLDSH